MGKFSQIFMELSAGDTPIFLIPDNNLNKCQGILTKLGMCIDIKEIWFAIANGLILSFFLHDIGGYYCFTLLFNKLAESWKTCLKVVIHQKN